MLSARARKMEIEAPIFCLVEAKKDNIEAGIAQYAAEMYAAQIFNTRNNNSIKCIYGTVTMAFVWDFLKLENNALLIDPNYVSMTFKEPQRVLSVLQWVIDENIAF